MNEPKAKELRNSPTRPGHRVLLFWYCRPASLERRFSPRAFIQPKNPDAIDAAFDNRAVLWAARLLLVSAAAVLLLVALHRDLNRNTYEKRRVAAACGAVRDLEESDDLIATQNCIRISAYVWEGPPMTHEELDKQIERTLRPNHSAIHRARKRSGRLIRAAERFDPAFDRALERLRQGVR